MVEIERRGLVGACVLAQDDGVEIVAQATGIEFLILHLVEAIAAHVYPITLLAQVVHQFVGTVDNARFRGAEVEELVTDLQTELTGYLQPPAHAQRATEALYDQVVARDVAFGVLRPEIDVRCPVGIVEDLRGGEIASEAEGLESLAQGNHRIAVSIIQGVVEIDEKVVVFHCSLFTKYVSVVIYQQDGERTIGYERIAVSGTVSDDRTGKGLTPGLRQAVPEFAGQGDVADVDVAA